MKWPGEEANLVAPQVHNPLRSQDDAMIGFNVVYQRNSDHHEFPPGAMPTVPGKLPARWTLGAAEEMMQHQQHPNPEQQQQQQQQQMIFMNSDVAMMAQHPHPGLPLPPHIQPRPIAPATKKLWGEDQRDDKGLLHLNEHQPWRDSTWSTAANEHAVSQPMSMGPRRSGSFPGSDAANMLSPRSTDTGGLGVKMVEYVLGSSPTTKDHLEARMRNLVLSSNDTDKKKEDMSGKPPGSPYDKKEEVNGNGQTNGHITNGMVDDDKAFNRTPGSRQGSPGEEELTKNHSHGPVMMQVTPGGIIHHPKMLQAAPMLHEAAERHMNGLPAVHFEPGLQGPPLDPGPGAFDPTPYSNAQAVDSSSLDLQQLFRSQQQQQSGNTQIQVLQQQQYLHQQAAAAAASQQLAFNAAPYVINGPEPYILAGPTVMPQYYGIQGLQAGPWLYQTSTIPIAQNGSGQQRRPMSPTSGTPGESAALAQGQYLIPYIDQNGSGGFMMRGLGNGNVRLVSPAPVIAVNSANSAGSSMRLPQQMATPPAAASLYNANQPSLYSSATPNGTVGLTASTGRRDSFDRNTSTFSPGLDYARGKWGAANYGPLGTVTAAGSPLGLTAGPSLTPPPSLPGSLGSTQNLQLGALMPNNRLLSAAPGAEAVAKYRNGLATMFGTAGSLLTKLASARPGQPLEKTPGRSRLLEDFRNNRFPNLTLRDLTCHMVEFSQDQHGSRFIQQKLERASLAEKQLVFNEILPSAYNLMTDVFGNYVIQKFFEFGSSEQKATLAQTVRGHVLVLALQMYGCRVIQKALESVTPEQQQQIVAELDGHVLKCVKDQNGNHVVQKCIECVDPHALQFIINAFTGQVYGLSTHPYGCRVIQRILEHCTLEQTQSILEELHSNSEQLVQDQYGNYVIQHVLEHGKPEDKSKIINNVRGKVLVLSQHKFASNVVEKCVTHATRAERSVLIDEVCNFNDSALQLMMRDQYANYVVQKMIDVCENAQRKLLMHKIRGHISALRKYTYGKHIIAKLDKFFMKTPSLPTVGGDLL